MSDTSLGKILEINKETIEAIGGVSDKINAIAGASQRAADSFVANFDRMGDSAQKLSDKLTTIKELLDGMGVDLTKPLAENLSAASAAAQGATASITNAATALGEFNSAVEETTAQDSPFAKYNVRELREQFTSLWKELAKVRENITFANEAFDSGNTELQKYALQGIEPLDEKARTLMDDISRLSVLIQNVSTQRASLDESEQYQAWLKANAAGLSQEERRNELIEEENRKLKERYAAEDAATKQSIGRYIQEQDAFEKAQREKERMYAKMYDEIDKRDEAQRKKKEKADKEALKRQQAQLDEYRKTPTGALEFAQKQVVSYNTRAQAIKYLEAAIKGLDNTDSHYKETLKQLSTVLKNLSKEQGEVENAMGKTKNALSGLSGVAATLKPLLASLFSIRALTGFTKKLIEVRGEFELQNTALASILDNKERADKLFDQVTQLAVKSPFTIRQLTTYTKELAAYQVEYKDLFRVTKQLADVSAGLGVDMQRLILAYGQVKAANYLRATEVRQFTEAGINILGELSKYYTELEGKMVSVADVQQRITKRMVEFGDVEVVFERITSAGGLFYDMQAKQAETLRGMWMNLQDRIDLLLNEVGQSTDSYLKGAIKALTYLMDHYQELMKILKQVGVAYGLYRLSMLEVIKTYRMWIATTSGVGRIFAALAIPVDIFSKLTVAVKTATKATLAFIKANWQILAIAAAFAAISSAIKAAKDRAEAFAEVTKTTNAHLASIRKIVDAYNELRQTTEDAENAQKNYNNKFAQLSKLFEHMKDSGFQSLYMDKEGVEVPVKLSEVSKENIDAIFDYNSQIARRAEEYGEQIGIALARGLNAAEGEFLGIHFFGDNLQSDAEDLDRVYSSFGIKMKRDLEEVTNAILANADAYEEAAKPYLEALSKGREEGENEIQYMLRMIKLTQTLSVYRGTGEETAKRANKLYDKFFLKAQRAGAEMEYEITKVFDRLDKEYGGAQELAKDPIAFKAAIDTEIAKQDWSDLVKEMTRNTIYVRYALVNTTTQEDSEELSEIPAKVKKLQEQKGVELFSDTELKKIKNYSQLQEELQKKYDASNKSAQKVRGSTSMLSGEYGAAAEEAKKYTKEASAANDIANAFGLNLTNKKAAKTAADIMKERIELLKKLRTEYEQNRKVMGAQQASDYTRGQFANNAIYKQLESMDVIDADLRVDASGLITALTRLADRATGESKRMIEEYIAELKNEQVIIDIKTNFDEVKKKVDSLFDRVELSKKVKELGLGEQFAEEVFDFDTLDLDGLSRMLKYIKAEYARNNQGIGEEEAEYFAQIEKKITEQRKKELEERVKTYAQYLKYEASEAVKAKLEEAKKLAEVEELEMQGIFSPKQVENMRQAIKKETQGKLDKATWDEFRNTETYIHMFEDLEYVSSQALDTMEQKLTELGSSLNHLNPHQLREIQTELNKIREQKVERSPIESLIKSLEKIRSLQNAGVTEESLNATMIAAEERQKAAKEEADELEHILGLRAQGNVLEAIDAAINSSNVSYLAMTDDQLREILLKKKGIIDETDEEIANTEALLSEYKLLRMAIGGTGKEIAEFADKIANLFSEISGLIEDVTGESSAVLDVFAGITSTTGETLESIIGLTLAVTILGTTIDSALGIIGLILISLKAILSIVRSIVSADQKKFEKKMEENLAKVEKLQSAYESLEQAIEECYDIDHLRKYNEEAEKTLKETIAESRAMIAMYKARKGGSEKYESEIEDLENTIAEAEQTIEELNNNFIESVGGFGSKSNLKSAAEGFVESWKSAFDETGNGLSGLQDKMDEFVNNAVQKQLLLRLSERYITPILEEFDKMFDEASPGGEMMTKEELEAWKRLYQEYAQAFDEKAKAYTDAIGVTSDAQTGGLTGLTQEYGQMTEATGSALAAINESVRYFVADIDMVIHNLENMLLTPAENPFYILMQQQAQYTKDLRDMIQKTFTTIGTNAALKVQII